MKKFILGILIESPCYWLFSLKDRLNILKSNLRYHVKVARNF